MEGRALGVGHKDSVPFSACSLVQPFGPSTSPRGDQRGGEVNGVTCRVDIKTEYFAMDQINGDCGILKTQWGSRQIATPLQWPLNYANAGSETVEAPTHYRRFVST